MESALSATPYVHGWKSLLKRGGGGVGGRARPKKKVGERAGGGVNPPGPPLSII